ncbi:DJ-1/PfpI family protein [Evansella halocellulosilytica]|uniref:DJ-1/PfpI family protein n=1 Tax=Evansella halocellulosilytica TaxID=2011013 RepID=UPI0015C7A43C|nr:DJ-1/PfpI family protein [Evansella halocellulosilytica]
MKKFAMIVYDNCAIWQVTLLQKFLKDKGWEMDILSVDGSSVVTDGGMVIQVDKPVGNADSKKYELLLLPGGQMTDVLVENEQLKACISHFEGMIAASCASAVLLASAGRIQGNYTTMPQIKDHYSHYFQHGTYEDSDVCLYENIITSKGFAHYEFMMAVLNKLELIKRDPKLKVIARKLARNK